MNSLSNLFSKIAKVVGRRAKESGLRLPDSPPLPLPQGFDETTIFEFLNSVRVEGAPETEMQAYCREDWQRFVYTLGLAHDHKGRALELGANPYFTTILLQQFTALELTCANYFHSQTEGDQVQEVRYRDRSGASAVERIWYKNFNIESQQFPFASESFDTVFFCEIIEHLQNDPCAVLAEIKRVLRPSGRLVLTTPNVARLENVARMLAGVNVYDPYSGYGPYGRHNREYNRHELELLLKWAGFEIDVMFTANVHEDRSQNYAEVPLPLLWNRRHDLGQYIFVRARSCRPKREKRPSWLYRSFPPDELE